MEIDVMLTWSANSVISAAAGAKTFTITDIKLYIPAVTFSIQDNAKLLELLKRTVTWNKYQFQSSIQAQSQYLDYQYDPGSQVATRLLFYYFKTMLIDQDTGYYLQKVKIKDYNFMIDGWNFFNQPVKNNTITYESTRGIFTGQKGDYTTICLLDYPYFKENYKPIVIGLSK